MHKKLIVSILLVAITLVSCSKDDISEDLDIDFTWSGLENNYSHFDSAAFGHFIVPVYENFIYKDSVQGDLDTLNIFQGTMSSLMVFRIH